jgi:hypothetical protein
MSPILFFSPELFNYLSQVKHAINSTYVLYFNYLMHWKNATNYTQKKKKKNNKKKKQIN